MLLYRSVSEVAHVLRPLGYWFKSVYVVLCSTRDSEIYLRRCLMYAIIATGGRQYKVSEGDIIKVQKLAGEPDTAVKFDEVLAIGGDSLKVGDDVKNASVDAQIVEQGRDKKVIVYRYKPKTGYHKKNGHRQPYTKVKIEKINA